MAGLYFHIPFCKSRCIYCAFYSSTLLELREEYVRALNSEMEQRQDYLMGQAVSTVYLGGGTPSLLTMRHVGSLLETAARLLHVQKDAEITMECNPDDLSEEYVRALRRLPVNRISMGIQSFSDRVLRTINRRHTAQEAISAVKRLQDSGLDNISIDLIMGLPEQSPDVWEKDIETALSLDVRHISVYHLSVEEGTQLERMVREGKVLEIGEPESVRRYLETAGRLEAAGFRHYEISNYAIPGFESRHNASYWNQVPYLGVGAAAHSYCGTSRQWNISHIGRYIRGVTQGAPVFEMEPLSRDTLYNEMVMTRLRTREGLELERIEAEFGKDRLHYCLKMARGALESGNLVIDRGWMHLSREGVMVSDGVIAEMMFVQ